MPGLGLTLNKKKALLFFCGTFAVGEFHWGGDLLKVTEVNEGKLMLVGNQQEELNGKSLPDWKTDLSSRDASRSY